MANTPNIDLVKPAGTDHALVSVLNSNSDKIDTFAGTTNQAIANVENIVIPVSRDGKTPHWISGGQLIWIQGGSLSPGLYKANNGMSAGTTLTASNVTADANLDIASSLNRDIVALGEQISTQYLALSDVFSSLDNDINGYASLSGNVMTIYLNGNGIKTKASGGTIGTLTSKYKPKCTYFISHIFDSTAPYNEVGTVWFYNSGGEVNKYAPQNSGYYICATFVING